MNNSKQTILCTVKNKKSKRAIRAGLLEEVTFGLRPGGRQAGEAGVPGSESSRYTALWSGKSLVGSRSVRSVELEKSGDKW